MANQKSQLMSIGEIAKALGITRRIILNYETKGLLRPDRKDEATGNRYYTADTLTRIRSIRVMQNLGISLDEIQAYYNGEIDLRSMIARLETLRDELNLNIEKLKERCKNETDFDVQLVTIPEQTVYCRTMRAETVEQRKEQLRWIIPDAMRRFGSDTSKRMYFMSYRLEDPDLVTYCVAVPPGSRGAEIRVLPAERALCIYYHGSYETIPEIREKLVAYARENGLALKGTCQHIYLEGPPQHQKAVKFITQVVVPLRGNGEPRLR